MVCFLVGCDQASEAPAGEGGGAQASPVLRGDFEEQPDDYKATLLLNDAFAAAEKGQIQVAEEKLAEVKKLTRVTSGIDEQVAEVRAKIAQWNATAATRPSTQPAK
jgi:hypothetical protein